MKIDRIRLHHLSMPLVSPFETSFGRISERECLILEVFSEGVVGYGECVADRDPGYAYETTGTAWHILTRFVLSDLIGKEIENPGDVHRFMIHVRGHPMAKASVEMALWDVSGKLHGKSLRQMFGGQSDRVEVGVSIGLQATPKALVKTAGAYLEQGYRRLKLKIKPGHDVQETKAVRFAFPQVRLQVDANSAYNLDNAEALLPLDEVNLLLIEQPLGEDDLWDHAQLQKKFQTALCLDESILSIRHTRQALEMKACRVVNIKAGRVGGLSEAIAIHDFCKTRNVPVWCGGMLETGVGRAANLALASLPGFTLPGDISATERYYLEDITNERFVLNPDSTINVPEGSGLGISLNREALKRYSLAEQEMR